MYRDKICGLWIKNLVEKDFGYSPLPIGHDQWSADELSRDKT